MASFRSYAQNQEDVSLWRALGEVTSGHYVEVGAYHPTIKSSSYAFYRHGWSGLLIEPQHEFCELSRLIRPRDDVIESAVGNCKDEEALFYRTPGGTRSTLKSSIAERYVDVTIDKVPCVTLNDLLQDEPWALSDFHFLVLDVEGSEMSALQGLDLGKYRPWVIVIEAIDPITREDVSHEWRHLILDSGYSLSRFDGVSQFYVADEHQELTQRLYPACSTDDFTVDFPQLSSDQVMQLDATMRSVATTTKTLLTDLIAMTGVADDATSVDTFASRIVELLEHNSVERIDQVEQLATIMKVAASRARLYKDAKDRGAKLSGGTASALADLPE